MVSVMAGVLCDVPDRTVLDVGHTSDSLKSCRDSFTNAGFNIIGTF
jgi:hypothetical protein